MIRSHFKGVLITGNKSYADVTREITAPIESKPAKWWYAAMTLATLALLFGAWALYNTLAFGLGTWGINNSVAWGWDIINFVWWIGIGHAGTAFTIFLLIFRQKWAASINRTAEAMTVFAVLCAALFPLLHMGRPWLAFFIAPYPNTRGPLWVNFNSPLFWDFLAISTYLLMSITLWYLGMIPDLATIRDRTTSRIKKAIYGFFSMGWSGSVFQYNRYETVSRILGGLAAPLVISVHSIVALDFAVSVIPGWYTTIFPPYFFVGAIFSGFAMVLTIMIFLRRAFKLKDFVTDKHLEFISQVLKYGSLIIGSAYLMEMFIAWYSGVNYEMYTFLNARATGSFAFEFWIMVICNAVLPQFFWFKKVRTSIVWLFIISIFINIGMWFERFVILVSSLSEDYLPSSWVSYSPTLVDIGLYVGTFGLFSAGLLMFVRFIPIIAINEVKGISKVGYENRKNEGVL
ncbi:MAG: polysulfide reductase NrfD [Bacteroidales bacterium]|nr:polysulfide reductase NrfD [Bacteroidales bacterium]